MRHLVWHRFTTRSMKRHAINHDIWSDLEYALADRDRHQEFMQALMLFIQEVPNGTTQVPNDADRP
jgi:hypothetical protein